MKFVHLTPQPKLKLVLRNGIRLGGGRRGRGVYSVPLMMYPHVDHGWDEVAGGGFEIEFGPYSSIAYWRWLRDLPRRHRKLAAVIFEPHAASFPASLYLELCDETIHSGWTDGLKGADVSFDGQEHQRQRERFLDGYNCMPTCAFFRFEVFSESAIGKVMHAYRSTGAKFVPNVWCEAMELVFSSRIPASCIRKVVPLYRSSRRHKKRRESMLRQ